MPRVRSDPRDLTPGGGPVVHGRGDARLDAVVEFVDVAARAMALTAFLDEAPARIATIFTAPVCSLYLLEPAIPEDEDVARPTHVPPPANELPHELVMRGNVGFPSMALGEVRLEVGEGITGMAVALSRPISVHEATHHQSYRYFAQLGEERFPVFLCAPILGPEGPLGAVTVQREEGRPFEGRDVELLVALAASLANAVLRAELLDQLREQPTTRGPGGGTRRVTLPGRAVVPGRAIGAVAAMRRPATRHKADAAPGEADKALRGAFEVATRAIAALDKQARALGLGDESQFLHTYAQILVDARFLERAIELSDLKRSIGGGMAEVAREVARAARLTGDAYSARRGRDVEDLCEALTMLAAHDPRVEVRPKAVLLGDRLTVYDLIVTVRHRPAAIALGDAGGGRTRSLAALLGVPCVTGVQGLFRWAADGDLAIVDGDHGLVVLNPSKADVQQVRAARAEG